jgi:beta-phosphoglucomutase
MKAVIFDWDGTLADTFLVSLRAWRKVLGEDFAEEDLKRSFGPGARHLVKNYLGRAGAECDEEAVSRLVDEKVKAHVGIAHETELFEGAAELLDYLKGRGYAMAVCSSGNHAAIEVVIKKHGISSYFEKVVAAEHMKGGRLKPHPDMLLRAARELGAEPRECVVFEDSPIGIEAAKRAGMRVVCVRTGPFTEKEVAEKEPDLVIESLKLLDEIERFLEEKK